MRQSITIMPVSKQSKQTKKLSRTRSSTSRFSWHISPGCFPLPRFLGATVVSRRRPAGCSTGVSFVTSPSPSSWTCPDSIFFAADLVCTMVVQLGEGVSTRRVPFMVAVRDTTHFGNGICRPLQVKLTERLGVVVQFLTVIIVWHILDDTVQRVRDPLKP